MTTPDTLFARAVAAARAERFGDAAEAFAAVLRRRPDHGPSLLNLGLVLRRLGRHEESLAPLRRHMALKPDEAAAYQELGLACRSLGRLESAEAAWRAALRLRPGHAELAKMLGGLLFERGRMAAAEWAFRAGVAANPADGQLWFNLAVARKRLGRPAAALAAAQAACRLSPDELPPLRQVVELLLAASRTHEARPLLERLLERLPDDEWVLMTLAGICKGVGEQERAVALFERAAAGRSGLAPVTLGLCMARLPMVYRDEAEMAAARRAYAADLGRLAATPLDDAAAVARAAEAVSAFQPYYLPYQARCDRELQEAYGRLMVRVMAARHPAWTTAPERVTPAPGEPVRVGIVSGFFRWHTIWKLFLRGWMEGLDRRRLALTAYSTNGMADSTTALALAGFPRFVEGLGFEAMAERIRADRPQVLIWPEIGMDPMAARLATLRLAPVQCVSWGHPDTTGLPTMDWFLTSDLMEPEGGEACYSEQVLRLPGLGIGYAPLEVAATPCDFARVGLRPDAVVYLCCQFLSKYLPQHDRLLARIAARVPQAQFAFISLRKPALDAVLRDRLEAAFAAEGLEAARHVVVLPYLEPGQYAALNQRAEVYLDTIGWSGGNTTFEAVAAGLPVVTLPGDLMRGRHSAAILRRIGVTETIAADTDSYVDIAVRLGTDDAWRRAVSAKIRDGEQRIYEDAAPLRALEEFLERVGR
jgi:predicted O-linked N-acetylglucosamine transferase (SPINDLY family)